MAAPLKMILFCLTCLVPLLQPLVAKAIVLCSTVHHANGSITCVLSKQISYSGTYSWRINEIVRANEDRFNSTLVESRGPHYITFYSCHHNISYRNICTREIIDCYSRCPTDSDFTTVLQPKGYSAPDGINWAAVIGGSAVGVIALCVFVLVWWKRKPLKRCLQASRAAWCRRDYRAAPQDAEQHDQTTQC